MPSPTQRGPAQPGSPPRALRWILLIVFLDAAGLMLLSPVIPDIVNGFGADANRVALLVAWLATTYSSAQFLSNPLAGALSDRWGRKPILLMSFLGSVVTYLAFGWAPALWVLFAGRLVDGVTGASIGTSQAYVADITSPQERSRAMGLAGAALGLGFATGPLAGFLLARAGFGPAVPVYLAAGLAMFSLALAWRGLPESLPVARRVTSPIRWSDLNPFAPLRLAVSRGPLRALVIAAFLTNFAMAGLRSHFAFFAGEHLGFDTRQVYGVMGFLGVMMVVAQGGLVRRAVERWGDFGTLLIGMSLSALGFFGLSVVSAPAWVYVMVAILALGVGLATPTMASLVSQRSASDAQGAMLGSAQAASALGHVIGPAWAGLMYVQVGPGYPFSTGAAIVVAAVMVVLFSRSRRG